MATAVATSRGGTAPEGRNRLLIVGAIVFGLITAVLLFTALQSNDGGSSSVQVTTRDVLVVNRDVPANTTLTADMLSVQAVPADQVLNQAYGDVEAAVGLPVRYPLQAGEQVTTAKVGLTQILDEDDLALVLESGKVGFAVEADEVSAVGGNLLPGNMVDVIAVFDQETFGGITRSQLVLSNIEVLAIAQEALEPVPGAGATNPDGVVADPEAEPAPGGIQGERREDVERQPRARSVTLAVDLEQAQLLATLQSQDDVQIWLALRRPDDPPADGVGATDLGSFFLPPQN